MELSLSSIILALGLTLVAGLSTGLGSLMSFFAKAQNTKFLSTALGFSAGVMVYISFLDLMPGAVDDLAADFGSSAGLIATIAFFAGIAMIALIDFFIPDDENPHQNHGTIGDEKGPNMHRTGLMLALAIGVHNFPEGLATFAAALEGLEFAIPIVVAIAIHNIPEGIAVSVPIYHSTGNRAKALRFSLLSGLAEPVGALFGALFLLPFWSPMVSALLMAFVAGIMVYISFDELLPNSERFGHHHFAMSGVVARMAVMAISLLIL